jgi:hypothetical protein
LHIKRAIVASWLGMEDCQLMMPGLKEQR